MRRSVLWLCLGFVLAIARVGSPQALGNEFQVNTYTTSNQRYPSVAMNQAGDFVVVWSSNGASGAGADTLDWSVQGQRYASSGAVVGAQFQVNTYTTSTQRDPSVAMDQVGDFVVVWASSGASGVGVRRSVRSSR